MLSEATVQASRIDARNGAFRSRTEQGHVQSAEDVSDECGVHILERLSHNPPSMTILHFAQYLAYIMVSLSTRKWTVGRFKG